MPGVTINNVGNASRKRSRRQDDGDGNGNEDDDVDVRQASSGLQSEPQRKRVRVSDAGRFRKQAAKAKTVHEASDSSCEEEEDVQMAEADHNDDLVATQYEIMRDAGFKHLEHADEDDRRATQRLQQKSLARSSNRAGDLNKAADNGILESIECINFMCHDRLHVELGPLLNFIVGENGSGKSAVLTAITLCLGGKASSTNRGGALKNFVKEGKEQSRLIVKIKNQGRDAYQHNLYGDSIIIERHFTTKGGSGFFIKSETGNTLSKLKSEVDNIVEYYCLQVDNPLNILSQDNARQFLNQASAKQKYKFFLQGVQLQQLDDDYRVIEEYLTSNEHKEGDLEVKFEAAEKNYERAQRNYELFMQSEEMRGKARLLSQKAFWAQVVEAERGVERNEQRIAEADAQVADAQVVVTQKTQELQMTEDQLAQAEESLKAAKEADEGLQANVDKADQEFKNAKAELRTLQTDERDARSRLEGAQNDVREYEKKIREEEQRLQDLNGDAHSRKIEELEAARAREKEIEQKIDDENQRVPGIKTQVEAAKKETDIISKFIVQKQDEVAAARNRVKELERGQGSLYAGYEAQVPNLVKLIENDAGFEQKPIGPIGAHVQVLQPVWSPILEKTFGETLNGFIVTNKRDQQRLRDMMNRFGINRCPILIGNTRPIDTSRSEPDGNFTTILRILKIDEPLVRSQLIINFRIEQIILIEDKREAERVMLDSAPPRNVASCFHLFREKGFGWGVRLAVNTNRVSSSPVPPPRRDQKPRLRSDILQEVSLQQEKVRHLEAELGDLRMQERSQQQLKQNLVRELDKIRKTVEANKQRSRDNQVEIEDIQRELDSFDGADGRLEALREDLKKSQEDYNVYGDLYGEIGLRKQEKNQKVESSHQFYKAEKEKKVEFGLRVKKAEDKVKRITDSRSIQVLQKNEAYDKLQMAENEKARLEGKRGRLQATVDEFTAHAKEGCPERVHVGEGETYEAVVKQYESLRKTLKERERRRGTSDDEVIKQARESKVTWEQLAKDVDQVRRENKAMKNNLNDRLKRWRQFQRYISSCSRANFMYLLSERDFRGRLILDHEEHTLEVQVEPDRTRKNAAARNTKTLSGGEKSFSSICLLLAIWEAMGSPLRCLDEFDVFMDNVNRAISTEMLVHAARNSVGRQYILITPNAIEGRATLDKDVKIIRLTDPRQRRLADP
ncbi:Structural maintenance of chromosomes protein 6 [Cytospora paraplurivora]|uniref:Structural maintenance of chromosomes protein 6 n=1 Tax=Cytospora paraplurivora TaxID=2898453 RepID=A0AAN9UFF7_9PEZI